LRFIIVIISFARTGSKHEGSGSDMHM